MCGIFGWIKTSESAPLTRDQFDSLWKENVFRGRDATGVAYLREDGKVEVRKAAVTADAFFTGAKYVSVDNLLKAPFCMMHVRAKTKGAQSDPENNHPVAGLGWFVTHNGIIQNDDEVWEHYKEKRFAEVDTSAINLVLAKKSLAGLGQLSGGASLVAWNHDNRDQLVLARIGNNPFWLFRPQPGLLVWSSDPDVNKTLVSSFVGQVPMTTIGELPSGKALVVGLDGSIKSYEIKAAPIPRKTVVYSPLPAHYQPSSSATDKPNKPSGKQTKLGDSRDFFTAKRPHPQYDRVPFPSRPLTAVLQELGSTGSAVFVKTVYGSWEIKTSQVDGYDMTFRPNGDMRRWALEEFVDWWDAPGDREIIGLLNNQLPLEIHAVKHKGGGGITTICCPWCGVARDARRWHDDEFCCEYCDITSKSPTNVRRK